MVKEVVSYEGESGLRAILVALENVRHMLMTSVVDSKQAPGPDRRCGWRAPPANRGVRRPALPQLQGLRGLCQ
jgi:hypothetical protein